MRRIRNLRFLMSFVAFALFLTGIFSCAIIAEGVPAMPGVRVHMQQDGSFVSYQVFGDEFLNWIIDTNGDLLAFGEDEDLYYANWISEQDFLESISPPDGNPEDNAKTFLGFVVPTDRKPIGNHDYAKASLLLKSNMHPMNNIPKYLLEYARRLMEERDAAWREWQDKKHSQDDDSHMYNSLPVERNLLVIYIRFEDESNIPELRDIELSNTDIYNLVYNNSRQGSVAHYYKKVTGGVVKFIPALETYDANDDGIIRVTVPGSHKNWKDNFSLYRTDIVMPALLSASKYINLKNFTDNTELSSEELSIMFVIHGYESSNGGAPGIWGHASYGGNLGTFDGVSVRAYCAFGAFQSKGINPQPFTAGIVVHELGHHTFGFYDFYDIGSNRTRGITDYWSVMGLGSWGAVPGEAGGTTPTGLDAYHLSTLTSPIAIVNAPNLAAGQKFSLNGSSQFIKLETAFPNQYFLLQPRGSVGYDRGILRKISSWPNPFGGLMIYHIDEDKIPESTWYIGVNPDWETHPFLDIEEAHGGRQHLQTNSAGAAVDDLYYGANNRFDGSTDPNSNLYDSSSATTQRTASGVSVSEITPNVTGQNTPDGSVTVTLKVGTNNSVIHVTGIDLNKSLISMNIGDMASIIPIITPANASDKRVIWTSSNSSVAEVNAGIVTAKSIGTAIIRAASEAAPNIFAECTVAIQTTNVTLLSVSTSETPGEMTRKIDLVFDKAIKELTTDSITITNISGAAKKGTISGSGNNWNVSVSDVIQGEVNVNVLSYGIYIISGGPKAVYVYSSPSAVPIINTSILPNGILGTAYNQALSASGTTPINWSIESGSLPTGLNLSSTGVISGKPTKTGTFSFAVKAMNAVGNDKKSLSIIINETKTGITVSPKTMSMVVGETKTLSVTATPTSVANQVTWGSNNTSVATVSASGLVTGVSEGKATIAVRTVNGEFSDECSITVMNSEPQTGNLSGGSGGCSAYGYFTFALVCVVPFALRKTGKNRG